MKTIEQLFTEYVNASDASAIYTRQAFMCGAAAMAAQFAEGGFKFMQAEDEALRRHLGIPPYYTAPPCTHRGFVSGERTIVEGRCTICGQSGI